MRKALVFLLVGLLFNCAGTDERKPSTEDRSNPAEHCRRLGLEEGSEAYDNCISNFIHQHCMSRNFKPGSAEYAECESNLRGATFLRQQMQIRGF